MSLSKRRRPYAPSVRVELSEALLDDFGGHAFVAEFGRRHDCAPNLHAGKGPGNVETIPALEPPGGAKVHAEQQRRRAGAPGDDQSAGLEQLSSAPRGLYPGLYHDS